MRIYSYSTEVREEGMVNTPEGYVYCFKSDGYLGVMSATKIYIPAAFDAIEIVPTKDRCWPFFAVVKMNDKYGIVSYENELLLECIYDEIKSYKNSSTFRIILDNKYYAINFISKIGPIIVNKDYIYISDFIAFTDTANYQKELKKNGLDNRKYAIVERNGKYGIILDDGTLWIDTVFDRMCNFRVYKSPYLTGLFAEVRSDDGYWSYIDYKGFFYGAVPSHEYNIAIKLLYKNRYIVRNKENKWGIVDGENNVISDFIYTGYVKHMRSPLIYKTSAEIFLDDDGYVLVSLSNGVQLTSYYECIHFDGWHYKVQNRGKYGVYDKDGQCVIPCEYDYIGPLIGNILVRKNGMEGHIVNGTFVQSEQNGEKKNATGTVYTPKNKATYNNYHGSFAQDEMGYSDDDIDTIFDGDPSAYWNID